MSAPLVVGVPTEVKDNENRVALQPDGAAELVHHGHRVLVQAGAGAGSRFTDAEFAAAGAEVVDGADAVLRRSRPHRQGEGTRPLRVPPLPRGPAALHLPARCRRPLADRLPAREAHRLHRLRDGPDPRRPPPAAHPHERGRRAHGRAGRGPPPREPRGRVGGAAGGVPGTPAAKVTIIGGGVSGTEAAKIAVGMRAIVRVFDTNPSRLAYLSDVFEGRLDLVTPNRTRLAQYVAESDVLIGAVLVPGAKAPKIVSREMIASMRPGSVAVDIAIDQGGCFETSRATTHAQPTYVEEGVVHYCVANIPGAVARTSTLALTSATLPHLVTVADRGVRGAAKASPALAKGLTTLDGQLVSAPVAAAHDLPLAEAAALLG
ncbi:MAG: alanine dehydrogenase [Quadrisphaera sp.]